MIEVLDWVTLAAMMLTMMFAAIRSKILFEHREYKRAVFWAAMLIFIGRWTLLRWTAQQQGTILSFNENSWLINFINGDEFTAGTVLFLTISSVNLSIDWVNIRHIFRVEKQKEKLIRVESERIE